MNGKRSLRQRRILALAILVLVLVVLFSVTTLPVLLANQHYRDTIASMENRLQQLQRSAAIGDALKPQYAQLKRWQKTDAQYLKSSSAALAAAELQRMVKTVVQAKNAQILSTQILATRQEEGFDRVSLKVRIRGALENITQAFYVLETGEPFIFLDNVSIRASSGRRIRGQIAPVQTLDLDFELIGYMPHT
jgi:general secretion pathway protein M